MRPLFSYYGGKQRMASKIISLLPRHTVYVEPFCGGAAVMFKKPWPPATNNDHYREVLNDIDNRIINLYSTVQEPETFERFRRIVSRPLSRAAHKTAQKRNKRAVLDPTGRDVRAAADYWVNIQQSFGNVRHGGWRTDVFGRNSAAIWSGVIQRLPQYLDRMMSVYLECDDALAVIKRWDSPQTLFYCDPPYPEADQGDYYQGYTQADFERLCNALDEAQGSFVLSCYDNPSARERWQRFEFRTHCAASCRGKTGVTKDRTRKASAESLGDRTRTEVLWRVDRSANARLEIQKVWEQWGWHEGIGMTEAFGKRKLGKVQSQSYQLF
jgi:DNA adenine methylase